METPHEFYENKLYLIIQGFSGILMIFAGLLQASMKNSMGWFFMILGVVMIFIGFMRRSYAVIEFRRDAVTLKKAPISSRRVVPYDQVTHAEIVSNKKVLIHYEHEGVKDKMILPLGGISGKDRLEVIDIVQAKFRVENLGKS